MNEANFVKRMNWLVTGDSFLKEMRIDTAAIRDIAGTDGIFLTGSTSPLLMANGVQFDEGDTASITFALPMDYDQDGDRLILKFVVVPHTTTSHGTDLGVTSAQSINRTGAVPITTAATAKAESNTVATGEVREVFLSLSGGSYEPGDVIRRVIDVNNASTTEIIVVAVSIIYGSCVAGYNNDDRHRDADATTGD